MPEPQGLDLSRLLMESSTFQKSLASNTAALQENLGAQRTIVDSTVDLIKIVGSSAITVDQIKQNAELETQQVKIKGANALGTNLKDQSEVLTMLAQDVHSAYARREQAAAAVAEKRNTDFLTNPLGALYNLLTINDDIAVYNEENRKLQGAAQQMETLNRLTQTTNLTQHQLTESITAESIQASTAGIAAQTAIKANDARIQGLTYNADGIKLALQMDEKKLGNAFQIFGAQKAQESANQALAHLAMARERFSFEKEERALARKAKEENKTIESMSVERINLGMRLRLGDQARLITPGSIEAKHVIDILKSGAPIGKQYEADYQRGTEYQMTGVKILAPSPAQAIGMFASGTPVKLAPAQDAVRKLLEQARTNVAAAANMPGSQIDIKNKDSVNSALNKEANRLLQEQAARVDVGTKDNIFNIPSINELVTNSPVVQKLSLTQKVIAPLLAARADLSNPDILFGSVAKALESKDISYEEALQLSTILRVGVTTNMQARQLPSLGMAPIYSYRANITTHQHAMFGAQEVVNMTDPTALGRALNKYLATGGFKEFNKLLSDSFAIPTYKTGEKGPGIEYAPQGFGNIPPR